MNFSIGHEVSLVYIGKARNLEASFYKDKKNQEFSKGINNGNLISSYGIGDYRLPSILIKNGDGSYCSSFSFHSYKEMEGDYEIKGLPSSHGKGKTLVFSFIDNDNEIKAEVFVSSFSDCSCFSSSVKITNNSGEKITIERLSSLQIDFPFGEDEVYSFDGCWAKERMKHKTLLKGGRLEVDSFTGSSSAFHNPAVVIKNKAGYFGINLIYSGEHKTSIETDGYMRTRVQTGINDFMFSFDLLPGESFHSPEACLFQGESVDEISSSSHEFIKKHILPPFWAGKPAPIVFNSWEGVYFDFDGPLLLKMARKAKELGGELFVVDDGWFGKRDNEFSSLGDWTDYEKKTGGIGKLADEIRGLGLKFGIWMEPEMISQESSIYVSHPEYALVIPGKKPIKQRNQLYMDLTRKEVRDYVVFSVGNVLDATKASYLKWDYNRNFTDIFSASFPNREYLFRYMLGFYEVVSRIQKEHPLVLMEGCASGGARFDLGILCYFPQIWTSDNTDPRARIPIDMSTLLFYPSQTTCNHIACSPNNNSHLTSSLEDRFNTALLGNLGYELNPCLLTEKEEREVKKQTALYKKLRPFLLEADSYLLGDLPFTPLGGEIYVSKDQAEALAIFIQMRKTREKRLRLKGLNPKLNYKIGNRPKPVSGEEIMTKGIPIRELKYKVSKENTDKIGTLRVLIKSELSD